MLQYVIMYVQRYVTMLKLPNNQMCVCVPLCVHAYKLQCSPREHSTKLNACRGVLGCTFTVCGGLNFRLLFSSLDIASSHKAMQLPLIFTVTLTMQIQICPPLVLVLSLFLPHPCRTTPPISPTIFQFHPRCLQVQPQNTPFLTHL